MSDAATFTAAVVKMERGGMNELLGHGDDDSLSLDLPVFGNEQSKNLALKIHQYESTLEEAQFELEENNRRINVMEEHMHNIRIEVGQMNKILDAKRAEAETESHMHSLAERGSGRHAQEYNCLLKEEKGLTDKLSVLQQAAAAAQGKIDKFKDQMKWNQEELEQWALAAKQKEEDNIMLEAYDREDEIRQRELELVLEKLSAEAVRCRAELDVIGAEGAAKQLELNRTAETFRDVHTERQNLVRQWSDTVAAMRLRDEELVKTEQKIVAAHGLRATEKEGRNNTLNSLEELKENIKSSEVELQTLQRKLASHKTEKLSSRRALDENKDKCTSLKRTLEAAGAALLNVYRYNIRLEQRVEDLITMHDKEHLSHTAAKQHLHEELNREKGLEKTAQQAEAEQADIHERIRQQVALVNKLKATVFKDKQALNDRRNSQNDLMSNIGGSRAILKNLSETIRKQEADHQKQQELIHNVELQIQKMEKKVSIELGVCSDEDKVVLQHRISDLNEEKDALRVHKHEQLTQIMKLENEIKDAVCRLETAEMEETKEREGLKELELMVSAAQTARVRNQTEREETMVQSDLLRLTLKNLRNALASNADKVHDLETQHTLFDLSMEEKRKEMCSHHAVQRAILKAAEEERHREAKILAEKRLRVEKMRSKYAVMFCADDKEGTEENSQVNRIMSAAQKGNELEEKRTALRESIAKAGRETKALSLTVQHLHARNVELRLNGAKVDPQSAEVQMHRDLTVKERVAEGAFVDAKKNINQLQVERDDNAAKLLTLSKKSAMLTQDISQLTEACDVLSQEVQELGKAKHEDQKSRDCKEVEVENKLELQGTKPLNDNAIVVDASSNISVYEAFTLLSELCKNRPDMYHLLVAHAKASGIPLLDDMKEGEAA